MEMGMGGRTQGFWKVLHRGLGALKLLPAAVRESQRTCQQLQGALLGPWNDTKCEAGKAGHLVGVRLSMEAE